ncbi:uncharacterized protein LOC144715654 [Wolffia australiana]
MCSSSGSSSAWWVCTGRSRPGSTTSRRRRGARLKTMLSPSGRLYVYDGVYRVNRCWSEPGKSGSSSSNLSSPGSKTSPSSAPSPSSSLRSSNSTCSGPGPEEFSPWTSPPAGRTSPSLSSTTSTTTTRRCGLTSASPPESLDPTAQALTDDVRTVPGLIAVNGCRAPSARAEIMSANEFCLFFHGYGGDFPIGEAMKAGCVPIVVSDHPILDLPFSDVVDWSEIALFVALQEEGGFVRRAIDQ